jgi:iron complex outermembrane receptor protein
MARAADVSVDTVVVTAARVTETEARAPTSFVTVIDAAQHAEQVETVTDALAESVGVSVRRFGGLGAFSTLSIRGSSANQVQIYLDGIPLSRARNEAVNLADLPLDSLERIEVYRGTVPVSFGSGAIGGVVNLVTKAPSATPTTEASASYGSFNTRKIVAAHSEQVRGVDLLAYVTYLGSDGDFTFPDNDRRLNGDFSRIVEHTRENNAFDSVDAVLKGGYSLAPGWRLELTSETFFKNQGVPGIGQNQSLTAALSDLRSLNYLRVRSSQLLDDALDVSGTLFGEYERTEFTDRKGELGTGAQERRDQTSVVGGNLTGTFAPAAQHLLGGFLELSHERFSPFNALAPSSDEPDQTRLHSALALQDRASFLADWLLFVPTLRYEHLEDTTSATFSLSGEPSGPSQTHGRDLWSPAVGAELRPWEWIAVKGNVGHFERAPDFSELFGNGGSVVGNSALRPESGINRDVGLVAAGALPGIASLHGEYVYFNNDVDDVIVFVESGTHVAKPFNVSAARLRGHELSVDATSLGHLRVDANYTHQDAENRGSLFGVEYHGKQLPGRPADELYARLEFFGPRGKLYYEFNFVGGNFLDPKNFQSVPSRDIHSVGCALQAAERLTLSVEARNLTDNQISDVGGFPLPGRSFFGSAKIKF